MNTCQKTGCSLCCREMEVPLLNEDVDRIRMQGYLDSFFVREAGGFRVLAKVDGRCVFLQEKGCGLYLERPARCRLLPLTYDFDRERSALEEGCVHVEEYEQSRQNARMMMDFVKRLRTERGWRLAGGVS